MVLFVRDVEGRPRPVGRLQWSCFETVKSLQSQLYRVESLGSIFTDFETECNTRVP